MLQRVIKNSISVIQSKTIKDRQKEKILLKYACLQAFYALKTALILTVLGFSLYSLTTFLDYIFSLDTTTLSFIVKKEGIFLSFSASIIYFYLRKRLVST